MTRALRHALGCAVAAAIVLVALPAGASAAVGPPYDITFTGAALRVTASPTVATSTLAVQVRREGTDIVFTPAAASAPSCDTSSPLVTRCWEGLIASELSFEGAVLDVDAQLLGVAAPLVRLTGGTDADSMIVNGTAITNVVATPGGGNDSISISGNVAGIVIPIDPGGDDHYVVNSTNASIGGSLQLGDGNDVAFSNAPNLTLSGGNGHDTLSGRGPLIGNAGSDALKPAVLGKAAAGGDEPDDVDTLSYELFATPLALSKPAPTSVVVGGDAIAKTGIEALVGGRGNDTFTGTAARDVVYGGEGDDVFDGRGGGDMLVAGPGTNTVTYGPSPGPVSVDLNAGTGGASPLDSLHGFTHVVTGPGNDIVTGTSADETFSLGAGDDSLHAAAGIDNVDAGPGNDFLRGGPGADVLNGGAGTDVSTYDDRGASEPVNVSLATPGGDGSAGENDTLPGIESVVAGASNDTVTGDDGPNTLIGGPGLNTLDGGAGDDEIHGNDSRDVITGGPGNDRLFGFGEDDSINAFDAAKPDTDVVDCGASSDDDAQVDATDQVTGCEYARRADVPVLLDADRDGFVSGFDCNDQNPAINQGAQDVPGDGIDQNCDGFDAPVPFVDYGLSGKITKGTTRRPGTKFAITIVRLEPARGVRVDVTCKSGRGKRKSGRCPFKTATRRPKPGSAQVSLTSLFKSRRLAPGATVEFRVTAPQFNGRVRRFTSRATSYGEEELCLIAPSTKPRKCPEGDEL